jgi:hypothetical protein
LNNVLESVWKEVVVAIFIYYLGIILEIISKSMKTVSLDGQSPRLNLNPGPSKYKTRLLYILPRHSVWIGEKDKSVQNVNGES